MYKYIENLDDVNELLGKVNGFHDALLKEMEVIGRGFVDSGLLMHNDLNPSDCRLVIQQQSDRTPCTELIFEDVSVLHFSSSAILQPEISFDDINVVFKFNSSNLKTAPKIVAKGLKYRSLGIEKLGKLALYSEPIPYGHIEPANYFSESWIECSECEEVWEHEESDLGYVSCPKCNKFYLTRKIMGQEK